MMNLDVAAAQGAALALAARDGNCERVPRARTTAVDCLKGPGGCRKIGGGGDPRYVRITAGVQGDGGTRLSTSAAQEGRINEPGAGRIQFRDERVAAAQQASLKGPG